MYTSTHSGYIINQRILHSEWSKGLWTRTQELDFSHAHSFYRKLEDH